MKYIKVFESDFDEIYRKAINRGIPTDKFWEFVYKIDWISERANVKWSNGGRTDKTGKRYLLENIAPYYSWEEMYEFFEIYENLYSIINKQLKDEWLSDPGFNVSDDGYTDLCSSIIGAGKDFYYSVMKDKGDNHEQVRNMVNKNIYRENFRYIFQNLNSHGFEDDWRFISQLPVHQVYDN